MLRFIKTASKVTVGLFSGLTVAFAVAYAALTVVGYKPVAVYSGSMEPKIPVGGLVLDRPIPAREVAIGDVITFSDRGHVACGRRVHPTSVPSGSIATTSSARTMVASTSLNASVELARAFASIDTILRTGPVIASVLDDQ